MLLVVELPTGESFQSRDPAYILLKDLLRAARLPDKPQQVGDGEPIRWPLLHKGSLDQGAEAARDYVQGVMAAELEQMGCDCIWLIGRPAPASRAKWTSTTAIARWPWKGWVAPWRCRGWKP